MFVLSAALFKTGAVRYLAEVTTLIFKKNYWLGMISVMFAVGFLVASLAHALPVFQFLRVRHHGTNSGTLGPPLAGSSPCTTWVIAVLWLILILARFVVCPTTHAGLRIFLGFFVLLLRLSLPPPSLPALACQPT